MKKKSTKKKKDVICYPEWWFEKIVFPSWKGSGYVKVDKDKIKFSKSHKKW